MDLTFLGTGSAMPTGKRFQTGLLLNAGEDSLLIDCGSGVLHSLAETDVGYEGVDAVLLSHHHLDHVSDLLVLLKARWLAGETELTIAGPPGTEPLLENLFEAFEYMAGRFDLTVREFESGDEFQLLGYDIEATETVHSMYCLAYRIERTDGDGGTFVFGADSEASVDLIEFADGASVLVHDCAFPDDVDVSNHPTPSSLGEALAAAGSDIGITYLTHLYPHTEGRHEEMLESLGNHYDGDVRFARDGLAITVE